MSTPFPVPSTPLPQRYLLKEVTLIDGTGGRTAGATVLVDQGRIAEISQGNGISECLPFFRLSGLTLMPGLIDCHVHILSLSGHHKADPSWSFTTFPEEQVLHGAANAYTALSHGVTTVRDMSSSRPEVALSRALDKNVIPGSRVLSSGFVGMTAGHGDLFFPAALEQRPWKTADGPDACRRLVREYARMGTHWIKICTSGGVLSSGDESGWRNYTDAEIAAIADEAHSLGKRVAAHAHSRSGISQALHGGVDSIEHGTELDESLAELMIRTGAFLVPTLTIGQFLEDEGAANGIPAESMRKAHASYARQIQSIRLAHAAGVPIVAGTDSCMSMPFGRHARELQYLVEQIGLSPSEAIVCATGRAAEALGIGRETGTVQSGKWADVLVVNGDPLSNIGILQDSRAILGVFREGKLLIDRGLSSRFENPGRE